MWNVCQVTNRAVLPLSTLIVQFKIICMNYIRLSTGKHVLIRVKTSAEQTLNDINGLFFVYLSCSNSTVRRFSASGQDIEMGMRNTSPKSSSQRALLEESEEE